MENLYKIIEVKDIQPEWLGDLVVQKDLSKCRHNNDRTKVVLKLPEDIKSIYDVPDEYKDLFNKFAPYLTHSQLMEEYKKPEWQQEV